jgi:hypothetical protein
MLTLPETPTSRLTESIRAIKAAPISDPKKVEDAIKELGTIQAALRVRDA